MINSFESHNFESPKAESFILKDEQASSWLERRELYDPKKQTPPKEIFIIKIDESLATLLGVEKKIISAKLLIDFLQTHGQTVNISSIEESTQHLVGIKIMDTEDGTLSMSIVFPIHY